MLTEASQELKDAQMDALNANMKMEEMTTELNQLRSQEPETILITAPTSKGKSSPDEGTNLSGGGLLAKKVADLEAQVASLRDEKASLQEMFNNSAGDTAGELTETMSKVGKLEARVSELEEKLAASEKQLEKRTFEHEASQNGANELLQQMEELRSEVGDAEGSSDQMSQILDSTTAENAEMKAQAVELQDTIEFQNKSLAVADKHIEKLKYQLSTAGPQAEEQAGPSPQRRLIDSLQEKIEKLEQQLAAAKTGSLEEHNNLQKLKTAALEEQHMEQLKNAEMGLQRDLQEKTEKRVKAHAGLIAELELDTSDKAVKEEVTQWLETQDELEATRAAASKAQQKEEQKSAEKEQQLLESIDTLQAQLTQAAASAQLAQTQMQEMKELLEVTGDQTLQDRFKAKEEEANELQEKATKAMRKDAALQVQLRNHRGQANKVRDDFVNQMSDIEAEQTKSMVIESRFGEGMCSKMMKLAKQSKKLTEIDREGTKQLGTTKHLIQETMQQAKDGAKEEGAEQLINDVREQYVELRLRCFAQVLQAAFRKSKMGKLSEQVSILHTPL